MDVEKKQVGFSSYFFMGSLLKTFNNIRNIWNIQTVMNCSFAYLRILVYFYYISFRNLDWKAWSRGILLGLSVPHIWHPFFHPCVYIGLIYYYYFLLQKETWMLLRSNNLSYYEHNESVRISVKYGFLS